MRRRHYLAVVLTLIASAAHAQSQAILFGTLSGSQPMQTWQGKINSVDLSAYRNYCATPASSQWGLDKSWNANMVPLASVSIDDCGHNSPNSGPGLDARVASGEVDTELNAIAASLKTWLAGPDGVYGTADDKRVYLRLGWEMNGDWYAWSTQNGNTVTDYINMWRHIWTIFMTNNGLDSSHVQWIFSINATDVSATGNTFEQFYPGDQYVNWLAIDGYSGMGGGVPLDDPGSIFDDPIARFKALSPNKPVGVTETGVASTNTGCSTSTNPTTCKATYLKNFYGTYALNNKFRMVMYFDSQGADDFSVFGGPHGDGTATINGTTYNVWNEYKTGVNISNYTLPNTQNPRLITDNQFQGTDPIIHSIGTTTLTVVP